MNPTAPLRVSSTRWEASASSQQTPPLARVTPSPSGVGSIAGGASRQPRLHSFYSRTAWSTFGAGVNARHRRRLLFSCGARVPSWYAFFELNFGHLAKVGVRHLGRDRKHAFCFAQLVRAQIRHPLKTPLYPNTLRPPYPNSLSAPYPSTLTPPYPNTLAAPPTPNSLTPPDPNLLSPLRRTP